MEKTRKVVINGEYGGFFSSLRDACDKVGKYSIDHYISRDSVELVALVEEMAIKGISTPLKVVEIPFDVEWEIEEYDGNEWVAEVHRVWS